MPVQVDAPTGISVHDGWGLWGSAGSKLEAVATNNGDTSVIYAASGGIGIYQGFTFPFMVGIGDPINAGSITALTREYAHGAGHIYFVLWNDTSGVFGSDTDFSPFVHASGGSYFTCTTVGVGASGGLALSAVNGVHSIGFSGAGGPSNKAEFWTTQVYRTIDYGYAAGAGAGPFTHLISSIVGAFIGSGLSLREMPRISAFMRQKARIWLRPDEYELAWKGLRAQKHMRMA